MTAASARAALAVPERLPVSRLSVSSLSLWWRCPERWRRRYVEDVREAPGSAAALGGALGAALTAHFASRIAGEALSLREVDDLLLAEWKDRLPEVVLKEGESADELRRQGRQALVAYLARLAPSVAPVSVERQIELRFEGAEWSFVGYLDLEDRRGEVIDLKLRARHVTQAEADRSPQATAYLLARALEGRSARSFAFHSIRRGKRGADIAVVRTGRTAAQLAAFERRLAQTAREIAQAVESGDWPLAASEGWWCSGGPSGCPHFRPCPGGLGHGEAEVVALPVGDRLPLPQAA